MDYIFGTVNRGKLMENVKTAGEEHTDLAGFQTIRREYPDCIITDTFRVVSHYHRAKDAQGNCYDFYTIDCHNRQIDRTKAIEQAQERDRAHIDYIAMMADIELPESGEQ